MFWLLVSELPILSLAFVDSGPMERVEQHGQDAHDGVCSLSPHGGQEMGKAQGHNIPDTSLADIHPESKLHCLPK